jgi:hypothetical protein
MCRKTPKDYGGKINYRIKNCRRKSTVDDDDSKSVTEGTESQSEVSNEEKHTMVETLQLKSKYLTQNVVLDFWKNTSDIRTKDFYLNSKVSSFEIINTFRYLKEPYAPQLVDTNSGFEIKFYLQIIIYR